MISFTFVGEKTPHPDDAIRKSTILAMTRSTSSPIIDAAQESRICVDTTRVLREFQPPTCCSSRQRRIAFSKVCKSIAVCCILLLGGKKSSARHWPKTETNLALPPSRQIDLCFLQCRGPHYKVTVSRSHPRMMVQILAVNPSLQIESHIMEDSHQAISHKMGHLYARSPAGAACPRRGEGTTAPSACKKNEA